VKNNRNARKIRKKGKFVRQRFKIVRQKLVARCSTHALFNDREQLAARNRDLFLVSSFDGRIVKSRF